MEATLLQQGIYIYRGYAGAWVRVGVSQAQLGLSGYTSVYGLRQRFPKSFHAWHFFTCWLLGQEIILGGQGGIK